MRSRPERSLRTRPARSSARRCLVTACRDTLDPSVSRTIDCGPPSQSRTTICRRVASPSAANSGAASASRIAAALRRRLDALPPITLPPSSPAPDLARLLFEVFADELRLFLPAALVGRERLGASLERDPVEARLDDAQQGSTRVIAQLEDDAGSGLARVVDSGLHRIRVPAKA